MLSGIAVTDHRLLYLGRFIGGNFYAGLPDRQEDHTSCLGNADTCGDVLAEEQLFNGYHIRLCHFQKLSHILIDDLQTGREIHACGGGDRAAAQKLKLAAIAFYQTKADDPVAGVNS